MAIVYTQSDLDNLKAALITGATLVRIGDREIRYRDQHQILDLIKIVTAYLDGQSTKTPSLIKSSFNKGQS